MEGLFLCRHPTVAPPPPEIFKKVRGPLDLWATPATLPVPLDQGGESHDERTQIPLLSGQGTSGVRRSSNRVSGPRPPRPKRKWHRLPACDPSRRCLAKAILLATLLHQPILAPETRPKKLRKSACDETGDGLSSRPAKNPERQNLRSTGGSKRAQARPRKI